MLKIIDETTTFWLCFIKIQHRERLPPKHVSLGVRSEDDALLVSRICCSCRNRRRFERGRHCNFDRHGAGSGYDAVRVCCDFAVYGCDAPGALTYRTSNKKGRLGRPFLLPPPSFNCWKGLTESHAFGQKESRPQRAGFFSTENRGGIVLGKDTTAAGVGAIGVRRAVFASITTRPALGSTTSTKNLTGCKFFILQASSIVQAARSILLHRTLKHCGCQQKFLEPQTLMFRY
ncbi:hypothetical protein ACFOEZ_12535 [Tianweitania populi]